MSRYALAGQDKSYPVRKWIQGVITRRARQKKFHEKNCE